MQGTCMAGIPTKEAKMTDQEINAAWDRGEFISTIIRRSGRKPEDVRNVLTAHGVYRRV